MLGKRSQTQKVTLGMIPLVKYPEYVVIGTKSRLVLAGGLRRDKWGFIAYWEKRFLFGVIITF